METNETLNKEFTNAQERLSAVRAALECPCCSELLQSPMIFRTCGHCFCSVCIGRWLLGKRYCPQCNAEVDQADLMPCLVLGNVVDALQNGKDSSSMNTTIPSALSTGPAKLPLMVYHVISDDKLDESLKSFGLPTSGSKDSKVMLHREFTLAYNAQIDSGVTIVDLTAAKKAALSARRSKVSGSMFTNVNKSAATSTTSSTRDSSLATSLSTLSPAEIQARRDRKRLRAHERAKYHAMTATSSWRAVFSDFLNRPVYYNRVTNECTLERPSELAPASREGSDVLRAADSDDDVIVVVERSSTG